MVFNRLDVTVVLCDLQTGGCGPCQLVHKSTLLYPPILDLKPPLPLHLTGEWVSMRCEIKHHGLFLRRRLRVSGKSWHAEYWFYSDAKCTLPTILAAAEGNYAGAGSGVKPKVLGASDYDFHVERGFLTVFEKGLAESLQSDGKCGPSGNWQVGVARDLTATGGCPALGITLPTTEYELVRIESDSSGNAVLFLGQSEERKGVKKERPTHFQPPLLQCATPEFPLTHFLNSFNGGGPSRSASTLLLLVVFLV
ncbi:hypothetical protein GE061_019296 [Apolygus lucorum]|uniref:APCDD1 domain-containing protein n=1 Tax=Apolygus lucorum TaxID=248454 RepID=A0A8S9X9A1_APOLU|nr:hypothetical protein GE061_019296 [Apolygus lucorum]